MFTAKSKATVATHTVVLCLMLLLGACGGGGGGGGSRNPPPPPPPSGIGSAGGTVQGPGDSRVVIPQGALSQNTAIAIAASSAGAPPLPTGLRAVSDVFALTPHGTTFATPVTVTLPFNPARVPVGSTSAVYKTNAAQNAWEQVTGATIGANTASVQVASFSWFVVGFTEPQSGGPQITQQPQNADVTEQSVAMFVVETAASPGLLTYQWQRSNDNGATFTDLNGSISSIYELQTVANDNGAQFRVLVSDADGSATSAAAVLTVGGNPGAPNIFNHPHNRVALVGGVATFSVAAMGGGLSYQWERTNGAGSTFSAISGATSPDYTLTNAENADHDSRFRVRVSNTVGSLPSRAAVLSVTVAPPVTRARIVPGSGFSIARLADGRLMSWGSDGAGQLGAGPGPDDRLVPGPIEGLAGVVAVSGNLSHIVAILEGGAVRTWGSNSNGQIRQPPSNAVESPAEIPTLPTARAACTASTHSVFLNTDGTVTAIGSNSQGQLGDGTFEPRLGPVAVVGLQEVNVVDVACGSGQSFVLLDDGTVRAWGSNSFGQLGIGTLEPQNVPTPVTGLNDVVAIAVGVVHTLALRRDGSVWGWGRNFSGELGTGATDANSTVPIPTLANSGFIAIAAGSGSSMALRADGRVFVWGSELLGLFVTAPLHVDPAFTATPLQLAAMTDVVAIARGSSHAMFVRGDGTAWAWGDNTFGQIGNGQRADSSVGLTQVSSLNLN